LYPSLRYRAVRYAPDVIEVVRFGEHPAVVDDGIIEALKNGAGDALDIITIQPTCVLVTWWKSPTDRCADCKPSY